MMKKGLLPSVRTNTTSIPLLAWLCQKKIGAAGTVGSNSTGHCPLMDQRVFKEEPRKNYDYSHDPNNAIIVAQWNDKNVVMLALNKYGVKPLKRAKLLLARDRSHVQIDQPNMTKMFNRTRRGVLTGQSKNRIQMRSKKVNLANFSSSFGCRCTKFLSDRWISWHSNGTL